VPKRNKVGLKSDEAVFRFCGDQHIKHSASEVKSQTEVY